MNINGIFIIIANSIGAGLFGLPIICKLAGFFPSIIIMLLIALYMNITAKLIIKIKCVYNSNDLINISGKIFGNFVKIITTVTFILLFSVILSAYLSKSADLIKIILNEILNYNINKKLCYFYIVLLTIIIINIKKTQFNNINTFLMIMFIIIFILLTHQLTKHVKINNLFDYNLENIKYTYPILITSFGFHNILPYIKNINNDYNSIKKIINLGVFFTFLIYFLWIIMILSIFNNTDDILTAYNYDKIITELIINYTKSKFIFITINAFALLTILTSILGISISMKLFFKNVLKINNVLYNNFLLLLLIFIPVTIITFIYENVFFKALSFSGGILALILFGLIPCFIILKNKKQIFKKKTLFKAIILTIITILAIIFFIISSI